MLKHLLPFHLPQESPTPFSSWFAAGASFAEQEGCSVHKRVPFPQVPTDDRYITPITLVL